VSAVFIVRSYGETWCKVSCQLCKEQTEKMVAWMETTFCTKKFFEEGNCYYHGLHTCCWKLVTIVACTGVIGKLLLSWPAHLLLETCYYHGLHTCCWKLVTIMACIPAVGNFYYHGLHTCCWKLVTIVACTGVIEKLLLSWPAHLLLETCYYHGLQTCCW